MFVRIQFSERYLGWRIMLPNKYLDLLRAGISLHMLAPSLSAFGFPSCVPSLSSHFLVSLQIFRSKRGCYPLQGLLKCPPPPPSCSFLFWLCFRDVMEELGNRTLLKLQPDKLCSKKSFCTEVENTCFSCLEMKVKQKSQLSAGS